MNISTMIAAAAVAAGITMSGGAMAAEATASANVRSGPGTSYRVVDTLYRGEPVKVGACRSSGWCYITHPGPDGWVFARYLRDGGAPATRRAPSVSFSFSFGRGGDFSMGGGGDSQELVCLVTFFSRDQVAGGADADVERARVLPRQVAERRDRPNDRRRIFDYGTNQQTRETCRYLNSINN